MGCRFHPRRSRSEREADRALFADALAETSLPSRKAGAAAVSPHRPSAHSLLRELRSGRRRVAPDCEISIRLQTRLQARLVLGRFLLDRRSRGHRFVKVIHGKGLRSPGRSGILRREVPAWLEEWKRELLVERWARARLDDGGAGALYVILKPS